MGKKKKPLFLLTEADEEYIFRVSRDISDATNIVLGEEPAEIGKITEKEARHILRVFQTTADLSPRSVVKEIDGLLCAPHFSVTQYEDGSACAFIMGSGGEERKVNAEAGGEIAEALKAAKTHEEFAGTAAELFGAQDHAYIFPRVLSAARTAHWFISVLLNKAEKGGEESALPALSEIRPQHAIFPHTLVFSNLTKPEPWQNWEQMALAGFEIKDATKKQGKASTYLSLDFLNDGESGISCNRKLSNYSLSAIRAALSFYGVSNDIFTPRQLVAQMKGINPNNAGIKDTAIRAATRELDRDRITLVKIDATRTLEKWGVTTHTGYFESYLLPLEKIYVQAKGRGKRSGEKMIAYRFIKEPAVLEHARTLKQIYNIPVGYLKTGSVSATDDVVILRDYLLERIYAAKDGRLDKAIKYATLYDLLNAVEPSPYGISSKEYNNAITQYRKKTATIRKNTKGLFDNWIRQGLLKGYSERKKGKAFDAVEIVL